MMGCRTCKTVAEFSCPLIMYIIEMEKLKRFSIEETETSD